MHGALSKPDGLFTIFSSLLSMGGMKLGNRQGSLRRSRHGLGCQKRILEGGASRVKIGVSWKPLESPHSDARKFLVGHVPGSWRGELYGVSSGVSEIQRPTAAGPREVRFDPHSVLSQFLLPTLDVALAHREGDVARTGRSVSWNPAA